MALSEEGNKPLRVSDLERLTGVSRSRIHNYIKRGVLSEPERSGQTMAYYSTIHLDELEELKRLQDDGYPISYIHKIMEERRGERKDKLQKGSKENKRENILKKAMPLFLKNGYYKTTMAGIAEAAGTSKSSIYLYFPNKQSLFLECADDVMRAMLTDVLQQVNKLKDPLARMENAVRLVLTAYPNINEMLGVLDNIVGESEDPAEVEKCKGIYSQLVSLITEELKRAQDKGLWPLEDLLVTAFCVIGISRGIGSLRLLWGQFDVDYIMKTLISTGLFFGLRIGQFTNEEDPENKANK